MDLQLVWIWIALARSMLDKSFKSLVAQDRNNVFLIVVSFTSFGLRVWNLQIGHVQAREVVNIIWLLIWLLTCSDKNSSSFLAP